MATTSRYLDLFDENGFDPQPLTETQSADDVIWEFAPPPGDTPAVSFDARVSPGRAVGRHGGHVGTGRWPARRHRLLPDPDRGQTESPSHKGAG